MSTDYVEQTTALIDRLFAWCATGPQTGQAIRTAAWSDAHRDGHVYPLEEVSRLDRDVIRQVGWEGR